MKVSVLKGRGAWENPKNRFETLVWEEEETGDEECLPTKTVFYRDHTKSLLSYNQSPDVGFEVSFNPYRGCEHGCIYCYARPYHEYLGFSAGLDFETKIMVKTQAPQLLTRELQSKKWRPQVIALSGATDCYQPAERKFKLTAACLEVLAKFRNPVAIITKNRLVTRDKKILQELASFQGVRVYISITSLDSRLTQIMEPRTSTPADRLHAIEELRKAGIPVGVMVAPLIPALTEEELPAILEAAGKAGATRAGYILLRLPHGVAELFSGWLERHFAERKNKILHRLEAMRGGRLNDPNFGKRMKGQGIFATQIQKMFEIQCRRLGLNRDPEDLKSHHFRRPEGPQGQLFHN
ncbi:MAG: PA0069 family radical SAM protein [bacterium]|nr:PA0069 family radical SAM protein [bacterium]